MILLVTPIASARECCVRLQQATDEPVVTAQNFLEALARLRTGHYSLVIFDHHLAEAEPNEFHTTFAHLGDAILLDINFALTGIDRLVREAASALKRREFNQASTHAAAARALQNECGGTFTALLLNCGLASEIPNLPPAAVEKLASIREAAEKLRSHLANSASTSG